MEPILSGKHALITGATGDIGRAIAHTLWDLGATLHLTGRNLERLTDMMTLWQEERVHIYPCDLGEAEGSSTLLKAVLAQNQMNILVNNSGITKDNLSLRISPTDWNAVLHMNLTVPFLLSQGVLPGMMKQRWGRIINITSVVGHKGNAGQSNYVASKSGLSGLTRTLALEVASRGVTVNSVAPGFIETAMTKDLSEAVRSAIVESTPCKCIGLPEDVAYVVQFLARPESKFITGQTLHVNGGMYLA
jgi:3-oxoacyl-[acyl-carrier protein] reductase